nr:integrase, catalytic region, zinc finger, CCHC-type, peptidase aspartic, catalytic [Tanacetum cinerariifolium]
MTGNLKLFINVVWKFLGTVCFGNDHIATILGFGDLQWGKYLDHEENHTTNLYTINLHEMASASPICLMARASSIKSWLWRQRLSHLNFDTINDLAKNDLVFGLPKFKYHKEHLCPSCEQGKSKIASHPPKPVPNSRQRLHLLHMDLCGLMRIASINGKRKPDIFFLHVFGALCYPKNDREDIGKLGAKGELDLLFKAIYDDGIGGQLSTATRIFLAAQAHQVRQTPTTSISIADTAPTPTNSSSQSTMFPNTSQDVDGLNSQQQHAQQQEYQAPIQPETVADNVPNAMFDTNVFKLKKALYGLKQAPRAWYDKLSTFLLQNHFFKGTTDPTLFIRRFVDDILVDSGFKLAGLSDADYVRCKDTFKSTSAIAISCNPVQHSRTKHIAVRYHFIKEYVEKGTIELYFVKTDYQLADLFTKALPVDRFNYLVCRLGMRSLSPQELDRLAKSQ